MNRYGRLTGINLYITGDRYEHKENVQKTQLNR
jgi:hypothetical protein